MYQPVGSCPLDASSYFSPYTLLGESPEPSKRNDPYTPLRAKALATLEAMEFSAQTMAERGITWAEDQGPFGHVSHTMYGHYIGLCWKRKMEEYAMYLNDEDFQNTINAKTIIPVISKYENAIKRQVKYPGSLIAAFRYYDFDQSSNTGKTVLFSLKQQAVVAETIGTTTWLDVKTGRPADVRKAGQGWAALLKAYAQKVEDARKLK